MLYLQSEPKTINIMKKLFVVFGVAVVMALGMTSCKQKSEVPTAAGQAEAEQVETPQLSVEDIVAKAKAEGANWSVDEWKANMKDMMVALKPMLLKIAGMVEKMEKEPEKMTEILDEMKSLQTEYEPFEKLMNDFEEFAKSTENGKTVLDDEAWADALKKELGLPDDM